MPRELVPPGGALAPYLAGLGWWATDLPAGRERRLPTGGMQLVVNLAADEVRWYDADGREHRRGGAVVCAATPGPVTIDTADQRSVICVPFRAGGAYPVLGVPATALDEPVVELAALWGRAAVTLRERLLAAGGPRAAVWELRRTLTRRLDHGPGNDPAVPAAAAALDGGMAVADVADRLGLTPAGLRRRFAVGTGLTPKRYARIRRLQRLLRHLPGAPVDWSAVAVEGGWYDQAHLIHDFRELTGGTPGAYRPRSAAEPNHLPVVG
ncbi:helix-turn-helix domain-containing protein [Micromonospora sp. H33]|uniref:helix-turn-helix domain-containing protein n=1 Tax=Micromonospora sp. H33 TaxID=3452215 RepID=UPI003F8CB268